MGLFGRATYVGYEGVIELRGPADGAFPSVEKGRWVDQSFASIQLKISSAGLSQPGSSASQCPCPSYSL